MTVIHYLLVALFRWDMKWILKLGVMWGVTRLFLVLLACVAFFIDGDFIYDKVTHVQRINAQLERLEPCLQVADNKPNKQLEWGVVRKLEQSEWELRKDTDEICKAANGITVTLPNGNTVEQPQDTIGKPWLNYSPDRSETSTAKLEQEGTGHSREQLMTALRNADKAGDATAARRLAKMVQSHDQRQGQGEQKGNDVFNVKLPNGYTIRGVPEGTSKDDIARKAVSNGLATWDDFGGEPQQPQDTTGKPWLNYAQETKEAPAAQAGNAIKAKAKGKTFNFPIGTTPEQMGQAIDEYFASQQGGNGRNLFPSPERNKIIEDKNQKLWGNN